MILEVHALICNWCNEILPQGPQEIFHYNVRLPVLVHGGKTTDLIHFRLWHPSGNTKWRYSKLRHHIFFRSKFNRWWIEKWIDISYWGCRYFLNINAFCDCLLILNDEWFVFSSREIDTNHFHIPALLSGMQTTGPAMQGSIVLLVEVRLEPGLPEQTTWNSGYRWTFVNWLVWLRWQFKEDKTIHNGLLHLKYLTVWMENILNIKKRYLSELKS